MIQIEEKDLLWRLYKRYYNGMDVPPEPKNLCNYFWKAMGGVWLIYGEDLHIFVSIAILAIVSSLLITTAAIVKNCIDENNFLSVLANCFVLAITVLFSLFSVLWSWLRYVTYWDDKGKNWVNGVTGISAIVILFMVLCSQFFVSQGGWHWWYLFYGLLVEIGVIVAIAGVISIWYVFFSSNTNLGKNVLQYLSCVKNNVCPLVKTPQSHQDAKREAELNCGDG